MASITKNPWNTESVSGTPRASAPLWKFLPFLVLGAVGSIVGGWLVINNGTNLGLVSLALIFALPVVWISWLGMKEVLQVMAKFRAKLVWWHWIWLLSIISSFVFRYRSASEIASNPLDALAALRVIPEIIVGAVLVFRLVFRRPDWLPSLFRGLIGALAIFGLVCLTSSLWSVKASWTAYKSLEYLLDLSIVAVILATITSSEEYKSFIDWTWIIAGATLAWVWIGLPIWPELTLGTEGRLTGAFPTVSSNEIGEVGAILILVAMIRVLPLSGRCQNRAFYILTALLGAASMLAAETRSAIAGLAIAVVVVLFVSGRFRYAVFGGLLCTPLVFISSIGSKLMPYLPCQQNQTLPWSALCTPLGFLAQLGDKIVLYLQRDQSQAEIMSMSSRLDWWRVGYHMFMQHPFSGLGAYAGSRFVVMKKVGDVPQLHSDYLEVLVGTSIWGMIPLLVSLVGTWYVLVIYVRRRRLEPVDLQLAVEMIGVLVITTVHSFVNVEMTWHHPTLYLMVLGYAEFLRRKLKAHPPKQAQVRQGLDLVEQYQQV